MNYKKIYEKIINSRKLLNRKKQKGVDYFEKHHIIPKSCGGSNDEENLVLLTFKEHFICHLLLIKVYEHDKEKKSKMQYALWWLTNGNAEKKILSARQYNIARKEYIDALRNRVVTDETKKKLSKAQKERTDDRSLYSHKISNSKKGKECTWLKDKTYEEIYGNERAQILRKNKRNERKGKTWDEVVGEEKFEESKKKMSNSAKEYFKNNPDVYKERYKKAQETFNNKSEEEKKAIIKKRTEAMKESLKKRKEIKENERNK